MEIEQVKAGETVKIGPDVVTISGETVMIDAKHAMPDWQVREYSPMPIYFRNKKYFLRRKAPAQKPFAMRYFLEPWREGTPQNNRTFSYDAETVAQREGEVRGGHVDDAGRAGLIFLYPFLGLLWSRQKEGLRRFGFDAKTITGVSIFVVFGLLLLELVFAKMLIFRSLRSHDLVLGGVIRAFSGVDFLQIGPIVIQVLWLDVILFVLLVADVLVRYTQHLKDEEPYWGFLEWFKRFAPRKKAKVIIKMPTPPVVQQAKAPEAPVAPIKMSSR